MISFILFQHLLELNKNNMTLTRSNNSLLNKIRSPDFRIFNNVDGDGYVIPKSGDIDNDSVQSNMSHRNIHGLSIKSPGSDDQQSLQEYLPMRSPHRMSNTNVQSPITYTNMCRSAVPYQTVSSPVHRPIRSLSSLPVIHNSTVFPFPPISEHFSEGSKTLDTRPSNDSGVYSPSLIDNNEYFMMNDSTETLTWNCIKNEQCRSQSSYKDSKSDSSESHSYMCRNSRIRTISETSSGLGSIEEDPSRESLLQQVCKQISIPEEHPMLECSV